MTVGTKVKPSAYALRPLWERYLGLGDYSRKNAAKRQHDAEASKRGTIVEVISKSSLRVAWDNGTESYLIPYMVDEIRG